MDPTNRASGQTTPISCFSFFRFGFFYDWCLLTVTDDRARACVGLIEGQERLGRGGGVARMVGRDPSGHLRPVGAIDDPRSARPMDTSSTSQGSLRGQGRAWMGGQWIDMQGVCPGFVHPERRWDTLRCSCSPSLAARPAGRPGFGLRCVPRGCRK